MILYDNNNFRKLMCDFCCNAFKGWCESFTRTEKLLTLLEAVLLVVFVAVLSFLILHLVACSQSHQNDIDESDITNNSEQGSATDVGQADTDNATTHTTQKGITEDGVKCTWKPSHKTEAATHYYYNRSNTIQSTRSSFMGKAKPFNFNSVLSPAKFDADKVDNITEGFVGALVKVESASDIKFGCIVSIISEYWTLTAASCIESIEDEDSLDYYVMMQEYGGNRVIHNLSELVMHPNYQGSNITYDLCALKSENSLFGEGNVTLNLPTTFDYFTTTLGERLKILGFGKYRHSEMDSLLQDVRSVSVYVVPWERCAALVAGRGICAASVDGGGGACRYCAGTPLLRARTLLGVMVDWRACSLDCSQAHYVDLASHVPWLRSLDNSI